MKINLPKNESVKNEPTNYVIIADNSGSTYGFINELKETTKKVIDLMNSNDTITIGYFSGYNQYEFFIRGLNKTQNIAKLIDTKFMARGLTCFKQTLDELPKILDDVKTITNNKNFSLYYLSDGYNNSGGSDREVIESCRKLKGKFSYALICGYGQYYNRSLLLDMANVIEGQMNHISDFYEMEKSYSSLFKGEKTKKNIKIDKKYDLVWQVTDSDIVILDQHDDNSVDVFETKNESPLYAIDYTEIPALKDNTNDAQFVYSAAYVLSQKNKANLGVQLLNNNNAKTMAKMLRKAFTTVAKGSAENELKLFALMGGEILMETTPSTSISLKELLSTINDNIENGSAYLHTSMSAYRSITKKAEDVSKVNFELSDGVAKITEIVDNEDRPNVSLRVVRKGRITGIKDADLENRINVFNKTAIKKIEFPFEASTFNTYTLVANGDFNFNLLTLELDGKSIIFDDLNKQIDIFDSVDDVYSVKDFVAKNKKLIESKAHASVLAFFIKTYSAVKHDDDLRQQWGIEGAKLLEEMGLDYQLRYSAPRGSTAKNDDDDYIPFLAISASLKGAKTINAKDSFAKYLKEKDSSVTKKPKQNPGDVICWKLFDEYVSMKNKMKDHEFISALQSKLKEVKKEVSSIKGGIAQQKFKMITTNSWFNDVEKSDEFEYDGMVIEVKEEKEYI
jgi:hypothetical protein